MGLARTGHACACHLHSEQAMLTPLSLQLCRPLNRSRITCDGGDVWLSWVLGVGGVWLGRLLKRESAEKIGSDGLLRSDARQSLVKGERLVRQQS